MKINLIWVALAFFAAQVLAEYLDIDRLEKYPHIGACYYYTHKNSGKCNLTLVCLESSRQHDFFTPSVKSICLNQAYQFNNCCKEGYEKDWIGSISFTNCKQPELPKNVFKVYQNIHTFNMSYLGLETVPDDLFSDAAKLIRLDLSSNRIDTLAEKAFEKCQKLELLNLSGNILSEIKLGVFSSLTNLQTLDLSENRLNTLDINVLSMQLDQMKLLSIRNNQLQELNGFNSTRIVNMKIVGIDSNRFNCSYLKTLIQSINRTHLDVVSNRNECSPGNGLPTNSGNELTTLNPLNKKVDETIHENFKSQNEDSRNSTQTILLIINTTLLLIMTITLISALVWMLIRKRSQKIDIFPQVTYRRNVQPPKSIEQNEYEEIRNNITEPPAYLEPLA
ncbi:leucine-rich repeat transmembrane neuronal protein 4-like [Sitodiplosis mosellana]|uniref:leucine-rich repeat transmembrane neuronal protein 4-like n=1 Tax=Sitodiplosis mosellana TaxID=263140 RepID=UPI0024451C1E|nr:leucine-rich repeat transmembrane neuronal protein 4-like [Sitodiplosis mosellana]